MSRQIVGGPLGLHKYLTAENRQILMDLEELEKNAMSIRPE